MMTNEKQMALNLTRGEACDLMLACTIVMMGEGMNSKWKTLHDKVMNQILAFDTREQEQEQFAEAIASIASSPLTVRGLLEMGESEDFEDIDVCDDYDERCYIAFCGGYKLTEEGEQEFADALDIEVKPSDAEGFPWTLCCDTGKQARACERLFYSIAGYCGESDFDRWFKEV